MQVSSATARHRPAARAAPQHEFTSVSYERTGGRGQRQQSTLGGACSGAVFGVALLVGASVLLWWNEGNAVRAQQSLLEAERALASPTTANGLTYVEGPLRGVEVLRDEAFGVKPPPSMALQREVEVFLWKEHKETTSRRVPDGRGGEVTEKTTTHRYTSGWESSEVRSDAFRHPEDHRNPTWREALGSAASRTGLPFGGDRWQQSRITINNEDKLTTFALGPALVRKAERFDVLVPEPSGVQEALRDSAGPTAATVDGAYVYSERACAPSHKPYVGCVRVAWRHAPLDEVSILAKAGPQHTLIEWPTSAGAGYELALLGFGRVGAAGLLAAARGEHSVTLWLTRAAGLGLTWLGWALLFGPAQYLASWVPLLGSVVGCMLSLIALGVAVAHALTVVAIAWIAHRPLLAVSLLTIAAFSLFGALHRVKRGGSGGGGSSSSSSSTFPANAAGGGGGNR